MLLEGVRSLDEAVEEVREDKARKDAERQRRRDQERLERARLKAISRGHRGLPGRGAHQVEVEVQPVERGTDRVSAEPAIPAPSTPEQLPVRRRPSLQPVRGGDPVTVDLTAEDDTQALPRLDSLERKLKDLEQQFG